MDDDTVAGQSEGETIRELLTGSSGLFLVTLAYGWFLTLGARFLVPALLPIIKNEFALQNAGAGLVVTVIWLTYGGMQFPGGVLADRLGERLLLGTSTVFAAISMIGLAVAPTYELFVLAGAGFGTATGLFGPARGTALTKRFDRFEGLAFGGVLGAGSVGAAALPFTATLLADQFGWRIAVGAVGPAFLLAGIGLFLVVPGSLDGDGGSGSVLDGVRRAGTVLRTRMVGVAVAAVVLVLFAYQGLTAFYTTYLVAEGGLPQATASGLFAVLFLTGAVFQLSAGRLADAFGYRRVLVGVGAASVLPLIVLPWVGTITMFAVVTILIGVRLALGPMTNAYIINALPTESKGTMWGLIRTGFFVLSAFGSVAIGALADRGQFDLAIYSLAVFTAIGTVLYYLLPRDRL